MSNNHHSAIATGAAANAATFNAPLGQLDAALSAANAYANTLVLAGGNVATLANGAAGAAQKVVTVDATAGFLAGGRVAYPLAGGTLEYNVIDTVDSATQVTLTTNIGTGGIADNALVTMISESEYQAAQAIPHAGTLTLPQALRAASGDILNVQAFGAAGNGTTDDTAAIQAAIDAASWGAVVYLPPGTYLLSGAGTELLLIDKALTLRGAGANTYLYVAAAVGAATDVIRVDIPGEARFLALEDFGIAPVAGTPARYGINLDVTDAGQDIANATIRRVRAEALGAAALRLTNPAAAGGFWASLISENLFSGGISLQNCGDSVHITENQITGAGLGVDMSCVAGSCQNIIAFNNITSAGGSVRVTSGDQTKILYNQCEQMLDYTGTSNAMIEIAGAVGATVVGCAIVGNNINGNVAPVTKAPNLIKIDYAEDTVIRDNNLQKGSGVSLVITANAIDTKLGPNRWGSAEIAPSYTDAGVGTRNVVQAPTFAAGWGNNGAPLTLGGYWKDDDGIVHLQGAIAGSDNPPTVPETLFTLPLGYRPAADVYTIALAYNGATPVFGAVIIYAASGNVNVLKGPLGVGDFVTLDSISFRAVEP